MGFLLRADHRETYGSMVSRWEFAIGKSDKHYQYSTWQSFRQGKQKEICMRFNWMDQRIGFDVAVNFRAITKSGDLQLAEQIVARIISSASPPR